MGTARFGRFLKTYIWTQVGGRGQWQDQLGEILYACIPVPVVTRLLLDPREGHRQ